MALRKRLPLSATTMARPISFPGPIGGWNARDPLAEMAPTDAVYLENLIPSGSYVALRKGCQEIATLPADTDATPNRIRTLLNYSAADGSEELFAASESGIYDVTGGLAMPASPVTPTTPVYVPTTSNAAWDFTNTATAGGTFLMAVNGTDNPVLYNGTTWTKLTDTSTPSMTGASLSLPDLSSVMAYKSRLYFTEKASLSFWYTDVNAIAGTLHEFPLHVLCKKGGYLLQIMNWTYSTQFSVTDRIAILTSEGQVIVYEGYDPSNSETWSLVGVFDLPMPLGGRRCLVKTGGDIGVLTKNGLLLLSKSLRAIAPTATSSLTDKIRLAFSDIVSYYEANTGWEMANNSTEGLLFINVPQGDYAWRSPLAKQLVLNTANGGWCAFSGWNPTTITSFGGKFYFASRNRVYRGCYGTSDAGSVINIRAKTAFSPMRGGGNSVRVSLIRLNFTASGQFAYKLGLDTEFADGYSYSFIGATVSAKVPAIWDVSKWDEDYWDIVYSNSWKTVNSTPGGVTAIRFAAQVKGLTLTWNAVDCIVTVGGLL